MSTTSITNKSSTGGKNETQASQSVNNHKTEEEDNNVPEKLMWSNGETYEGTLFRGCLHGYGRYNWADDSTYEGMFYMDSKEGYGTLCFQNGSKFQGLFKDGEYYGPGVFSYPDHFQEVGIWKYNKLYRLCSCEIHQDFVREMLLVAQRISDFRKKEKLQITPTKGIDLLWEGGNSHVSEKQIPNCLKLSLMTQDENQPLSSEDLVGFNVSQVLKGCRRGFGKPGLVENSCKTFLLAASEGNIHRVRSLFLKNSIDVDIADNSGVTGLILSAVNGWDKVVHFLLDHGADINHLTDTNLTALSACLMLLYPQISILFPVESCRFFETSTPLLKQPKSSCSLVSHEDLQGYFSKECYPYVPHQTSANSFALKEEKYISREKLQNQSFSSLYLHKEESELSNEENVSVPKLQNQSSGNLHLLKEENKVSHEGNDAYVSENLFSKNTLSGNSISTSEEDIMSTSDGMSHNNQGSCKKEICNPSDATVASLGSPKLFNSSVITSSTKDEDVALHHSDERHFSKSGISQTLSTTSFPMISPENNDQNLNYEAYTNLKRSHSSTFSFNTSKVENMYMADEQILR
ncbi:ankyrin repeat and MYND domain-containing protein 1-like [Limulus polyphemus]|uniref:Ankyrin repeat and MYND domain-containing protein 1-like n=1 Tax=Limulus polyphemus TaxID=6850 RepID=A0ABM1B042_LIMPO|nr:ankyrin repeat and MYND domain-containing protein 1-like [Limulus polyphemus]